MSPSLRFTRIKNAADRLQRQYETRDPFTIAEGEGLEIVYRSFDQLKGFYTRLEGQGFIVLNQELPYEIQRIICAHELGHDQLHREWAEDQVLQEFALYDMKRQPEYEANLFAASLLLDDADVLEGLQDGDTLMGLASKLGLDPELLHLKLRLMDLPDSVLPQYDEGFLRRPIN